MYLCIFGLFNLYSNKYATNPFLIFFLVETSSIEKSNVWIISMSMQIKKNCFRLFPLWMEDSFLLYEQTPNSQLQDTREGIVVRPALNTHPHQLSDTQPLQTGSLHTIIILIHVFVNIYYQHCFLVTYSLILFVYIDYNI